MDRLIFESKESNSNEYFVEYQIDTKNVDRIFPARDEKLIRNFVKDLFFVVKVKKNSQLNDFYKDVEAKLEKLVLDIFGDGSSENMKMPMSSYMTHPYYFVKYGTKTYDYDTVSLDGTNLSINIIDIYPVDHVYATTLDIKESIICNKGKYIISLDSSDEKLNGTKLMDIDVDVRIEKFSELDKDISKYLNVFGELIIKR